MIVLALVCFVAVTASAAGLIGLAVWRSLGSPSRALWWALLHPVRSHRHLTAVRAHHPTNQEDNHAHVHRPDRP